MRRTPWQLLAGAVLLVLLATLATLQYRWLGQVSDAEREERRAAMSTRAQAFSEEFDREITRAYTAFSIDADAFSRDAAGALSDAYGRAQSQSIVGGIVKAVYLLNRNDAATPSLQRLDPQARTLAAAEWPASFASLQKRLEGERFFVTGFGGPQRVVIPGAVDATALALIVPVVQPPSAREGVPSMPPSKPSPMVIAELDADRLGQTLIKALAATHFGPADTSDDVVTVTTRADPPRIVYSTDPAAPVTRATADVATGVFGLRLINTYVGTGSPTDATFAQKTETAIAIVQHRVTLDQGKEVALSAGELGAWELLVRGRRGSLDAIVAQSRRRNLAIGLGVLGLLAASFLLVIASAQRQRNLVRQQMEFVAAMSHELRTPLAVIRSAGDNLADGVVADRAQVKQYGTLIQAEGRRLSDMVERVMSFAGISSGAPLRMRPHVDIARAIDEAVAGTGHDAADRGVAVSARVAGPLPSVAADPDALRSALQNIIGNAIKYSPAGAPVELEARATASEIVIAVTDHGLGIDATDLPHIFRPFYRGRRAVDAQVRGTGVGLSIVRQVLEAHHGAIDVRSRVGEGTTVTVTLPIEPAGASVGHTEPEAAS